MWKTIKAFLPEAEFSERLHLLGKQKRSNEAAEWRRATSKSTFRLIADPNDLKTANNKSLIEMILRDNSSDHSCYDSNPQQDFVLTLRRWSAINQRAAAMATGSTVTVRPLASPFPSGCLLLLSPKARMRCFFPAELRIL